jgi:hypothetical protein
MSCSYVFNRGKNKGGQCAIKPRQGSRCWKHPEREKAVPADLSTDEVFGEPEPVATAPTAKLRSSVWTWTVVSNTKFEGMSTAEKMKFKNWIEYVFSQDNITDFITDQNSPDDSRKNINKIEIDFAFERAPTTDFLHAHGFLHVLHSGFMRFRVNDLRAFALKIFKKNFHIHMPCGYDALQGWKNYCQKNQSGNKVEI